MDTWFSVLSLASATGWDFARLRDQIPFLFDRFTSSGAARALLLLFVRFVRFVVHPRPLSAPPRSLRLNSQQPFTACRGLDWP